MPFLSSMRLGCWGWNSCSVGTGICSQGLDCWAGSGEGRRDDREEPRGRAVRVRVWRPALTAGLETGATNSAGCEARTTNHWSLVPVFSIPCSRVPLFAVFFIARLHCSLRPRLLFVRGLGVDFGAGAVGIYKHFIGDAADVGFGDLVDFVELEEELDASRRSGSGTRRASWRVPGCRPGRGADRRGCGSCTSASSASVTSVVLSLSISLCMASRISAGVWPGRGTA